MGVKDPPLPLALALPEGDLGTKPLCLFQAAALGSLLGIGALPGTLGPLGTWGFDILRLALGWGSVLGLLRLIILGGKASGWKPAPPGVGVVILAGLLLGGDLVPRGGLLSLNSSEEE